MSQAVCRLTVLGPAARADLAIPAEAPLTMLLPELVRRCAGGSAEAGSTPWVLGRPGQQPIPPARSLGEAGVLDGEILHLTRLGVAPPPLAPPEVPIEAAAPPSRGQVPSGPSLGAVVGAGSGLIVSAVIALAATLAELPLTATMAVLGVSWVLVAEYVLPRVPQPQEAGGLRTSLLIAGGAIVALGTALLGLSGNPYDLGLAAALIAGFGLSSWGLLRAAPLPGPCTAVKVLAGVTLLPLLLGTLGVYSLIWQAVGR